MYRYFIRRFLLMIPTLIGVAFTIFLLMRLVPGDIVELRMVGDGQGQIDPAVLAAERARLGLDKPLHVQFLTWIGGVFVGDFGESMWTGRRISDEVAVRFPVSFQIAWMATLFATFLSIPLGTLGALKQDTYVDYGVRIFSIAGLAMPSFWLGILMVLFTLHVFQWSPPVSYRGFLEAPLYNLSMVIWPVMATGYRYSAVATRMTRSSVLEVLREDYIRTAKAKGMVERLIIYRHALTNAMLPVITVLGLEFAFLLGGLVVTEQVFNLNGIGSLFVQSVNQKDFTMVQALVMIVASVFVLSNFVVDILYAWLDPRISYK